ncbi:hypothetical protein PoB_002384600 [Plakobranchus ocellatus]|uniref:Uncharacterized protein n=1 Tax=Plakobranchus ocellatus TaxID=259542 RepID=A0AAV3ZDL8_9GAST|nr:hypothetical protein PoB_002384600 [Plakobranchus ocellatus]
MSDADDLSTTFHRLLFPGSKPRPGELHTSGPGAAAPTTGGIPFCCWYLGIIVLALSPLPTKRTDVLSSVRGCLRKGMYYELKTHGLTPMGAPTPAHGEANDVADGRQDTMTKIMYKQSSPGPGVRVIKLSIKKPSSLVETFQDCKKRLMYSLTSPAKQAKKERRQAMGDTAERDKTAAAPALCKQGEDSDPVHVFNTAKTMAEQVDHVPQYTDTGPSTTNKCVAKPQTPTNEASSRLINYTSPKATSPTRKRRKKRQQQRSIFSRPGKNNKPKELENLESEAVSVEKDVEIKPKMSACGKDKAFAHKKSAIHEALSKRCDAKVRGNDFTSIHSPVHTAKAARELKNLIRQVGYESRPTKSVSPRLSMSFMKIDSKALHQVRKTRERHRERAPHGMKPSNQGNKDRQPYMDGAELFPRGVSPKHRSQKRVTQKKQRSPEEKTSSHQTLSRPQSKSDDNSCIAKGVSTSILSKVASMLSAEERGWAKNGSWRNRLEMSQRAQDKTKEISFKNEQHKAFVQAPMYSNTKSPFVEPPLQTKPSQMLHNFKKSKRTRESAMQTERINKSLTTKNRALAEPRVSGNTNEDFKNKKPQTIGHWKTIYRSSQKQNTFPGGTRSYQSHHRVSLPERLKWPLARNLRGFASETRPQEPVSNSQSSQYSCLGCIDPTDSTVPPEGVVVERPLRRNADKQRIAGRKKHNKPQPIEGYILNSKNPIANTLLLCKSGITTTYENWANIDAQGSGAVKACSQIFCSNKFPSLSSYLDYLEKKTSAAQDMDQPKLQKDKRRAQSKDNQPPEEIEEVLGDDVMFHEQIFGTGPTSTPFSKSRKSSLIVNRSGSVRKSKHLSPKVRQSQDQAEDTHCESPEKVIEQEPNISEKIIDRVMKNPLVSAMRNEFEAKAKTTDKPNVVKHSAPAKAEESSRFKRPKLKFKYLPLKRQPLPYSRTQNTKKEKNDGFTAHPQSLYKKIEHTKSCDDSDTRRKIYPKLSIDTKKAHKESIDEGAGRKVDVKGILTEANDYPKEPAQCKSAKPEKGNKRSLTGSKTASPKHLRSKETIHSASFEKKNMNNLSAEETTLSVDLNSLMEMAKTVLKKSKRESSQIKHTQTAIKQFCKSKLSFVKSDDQTSEASHAKCSQPIPKEPESQKCPTPGDQSYTHFHKMRDSQGIKPWRTTKAFTNRLKLILQRNKEDCMRRRAEKTSKPKRDKNTQRVYVVHKAVPQSTSANAKSDLGASKIRKNNSSPNFMKQNVPDGSTEDTPTNKNDTEGNVLSTVSEKGKKRSTSRPPTLRTEALAKKRRKNAQTVQHAEQQTMSTLLNKKKLKCKGTPLQLTTKQLCKDAKEEGTDNSPVQLTSAQFGYGTQQASPQDVQQDLPALLAEALKRRLPLVGRDPAQVAKWTHNAPTEELSLKNHLSANATALFRTSQVQSELCLLLNKIQTRTDNHVIKNSRQDAEGEIGKTLEEDGAVVNACPEKPPQESVLNKEEPIEKGILIESQENAMQNCVFSFPFWKPPDQSPKQASAKTGEHPFGQTSDTLLIHSELDPDPSTAALKVLTQCECNKFHSMPNLPGGPHSQSQPRSDDIQQKQQELSKKSVTFTESSGICVNESNQPNCASNQQSFQTSPAAEIIKCDSFSAASKVQPVQDHSFEPSSSKKVSIAEQSKADEVPAVKKSSGCEESKKASTGSITFPLDNSSCLESKLRKHGQKRAAARLCGSDEMLSKRMAQTAHGESATAPYDYRKLAIGANMQIKRVRMTINSPECTKKKVKIEPTLKLREKNGDEGSNSYERKNKLGLIAGKAITGTDVRLQAEYDSPTTDYAAIGGNSLNLQDVKFSPEKNSIAGESSPCRRVPATGWDNDKSAVSFSRLTTADKVVQECECLTDNQEEQCDYQYDVNNDSIHSASLLTSSALNNTDISDYEPTILSNSTSDMERHLASKKSTDISPTVAQERGMSSTSGYVTVSSNSVFSGKAKLCAQSLHTERPQSENSRTHELTPSQAAREPLIPTKSKATCNVLDVHVSGQVGARKVLSHITEESDHSDAHSDMGVKSRFSDEFLTGSSKKIQEYPNDPICMNETEVKGRPAPFNTSEHNPLNVVRLAEQRDSKQASKLENQDTNVELAKCASRKRTVEKIGSIDTASSSIRNEQTRDKRRSDGSLQPRKDPIFKVGDLANTCKGLSVRLPLGSSEEVFRIGDDKPSSDVRKSIVRTEIDTDKLLSKSEPNVKVGKMKYKREEVPVTIIYTTGNSEIPDLSFINEDEISLDSWTQNSAVLGKTSLGSESCIICDDNNDRFGQPEKWPLKECSSVDMLQNTVTEIYVSSEETLKTKETENLPSQQNDPQCDENPESETIENKDESNDSDAFEVLHHDLGAKGVLLDITSTTKVNSDKTSDLESLLDSALDKSSTLKKSPRACLALTTPGGRKARDRRAVARASRPNRQLSTDLDEKLHDRRESHGPLVIQDTPQCEKITPTENLASCKNNASSEMFFAKTGTSSQSVKIDSKPISFQTNSWATEDNGDEKTLRDILKDVSTQPFGLMWNRKSKRDKTKSVVCEESNKKDGQEYSSQQRPFWKKATDEPMGRQEGGVVNTEDGKLFGKSEAGRESQSSVQIKPTLLVPSFIHGEAALQKGPESSDEIIKGANARKTEDENNLPRKPLGVVQLTTVGNVSDEMLEKKSVTRKLFHGDRSSINQKGDQGSHISSKGIRSSGKEKTESIENHNVKILTDDNKSSGQNSFAYELRQTTREINDNRYARHDDPCESSSSSIVLSWVGSGERCDLEGDCISLVSLPCLEVDGITDKSEPGKTAQCKDMLDSNATLSSSFKDESRGLWGENDSTRVKLNKQFEQKNVNENKPRARSAVFTSHSNRNLNRTSETFANEKVDHDTEDAVQEALRLNFDGCAENDIEGNNCFGGCNFQDVEDGILEQETYLYNLARNLKWDDDVPSADWLSTATTGQRDDHLQIANHTQGVGDTRCGYVISAWTNQHLNREQASITARSVGLRPTSSSSLKSQFQGRTPSKLFETEEKPIKRCGRYDTDNRDSLYPTQRVRKLEGIENGSSSCGGQGSSCTKPASADPKASCCSTPWSRRGSAAMRDLAETSLLKPSSAKYDSLRKESVRAPTLEEHLRSRHGSCFSHWHRGDMSRVAGSDIARARTRPFMSLHDHLSTRSEAAWQEARQADMANEDNSGDNNMSKSPSSHSSLNWYRPQSLSSSNSMSNSQMVTAPTSLTVTATAQPSAMPLLEPLDGDSGMEPQLGLSQGVRSFSSRQDKASEQDGPRQQSVAGQRRFRGLPRMGSVLVTTAAITAATTPNAVTSRRDERAPITAATTPNAVTSRRDERADRPILSGPSGGSLPGDSKKVSKIVEMFEMKNSSSRQ